MPVWPKSIHTFGVNLRTAATEWKLRQTRAAPAAQAGALAALLPRLAQSTYWRQTGVEAGMDYAQFQARVPLQTHEQLAPAIERMKRGEADVLWPGSCALFALSSGTSTGQLRSAPVTEEMLRHFRRAGMETLLYYTVRARHAGVFRGRHLLLGSSTALTSVGETGRHEAYAANLSGIVEVSLSAWAERHLYEPGAAIARIPDWDARLDAIFARTCSCDIALLAGLPNWVLELARELQERSRNTGQPIAHLQALWPNLECFVHTGVSLAPYAAELRAVLGPAVKFHEVYAAPEGFIATQDTEKPADGLRLMADLGLYFEFLPMTDFDESRLALLGARAVPLTGVKTDIDYALIVTTPGGLVRTVLGDIVRFTSTQPPRLVHAGRTALLLNTFAERVTEKELTDSLVAVCARHHWAIVNFHVAPLTAKGSMTGQLRGSHEWWIELKPGTIATPKGPQIAEEVDTELQRLNPLYAMRRRSGSIDAPTVRLVMPGVFEHWLRYKKSWDGHYKSPRCRGDRDIADQLAQITNFARD